VCIIINVLTYESEQYVNICIVMFNFETGKLFYFKFIFKESEVPIFYYLIFIMIISYNLTNLQ
jgi:hypothetical protein